MTCKAKQSKAEQSKAMTCKGMQRKAMSSEAISFKSTVANTEVFLDKNKTTNWGRAKFVLYQFPNIALVQLT